MHYLFATEAKAATAISFSAISEAVAAVAKASSTATTTSASTVAKTVVTEVAKQTGAKAAVGLGTKIAALPLVAKIAAGVVAVCVAVGVPIAVNKITSSDNSSSNGAENIVATEKSFDILNEQIVFEETVILDEEDFMIKVLDIIIDGEYDYSLEVEITNKSDKPYEFNISQSYINGVLLSNYDKLMLNCEIEANSTEIEEIVFRNRDILDCLQKISEIKLNFSVGNTPGDDDFEYDDYFKDYEATPIYPYGKNNAKEFKIGNNYNRIIYSDSKVAAYLLPKSEQFDGQGDFRLTFFVENNTGSRVFFGTNDCEINDTEIEQLNRNYGIGVSKKTKMFYSMIFRKEELIKNNIFEVEKVSFDAVVENTKGDELFNENIVLVFKNVEKTATPEQVKEAIDARHKVLITAFGIDNWRNRADITSIIEDNLDLVLKVAPEEVWRNISFVSADSSLVDIVKAQIYTHYEYIMPGYNYNAGIGFDINYEVVGVVKMSDDELSSFCDEINRNKGNEDVIITNVYDEIPLYAGNYLKSETITECYKTTVEYVLTGQKKTFKRKKTYNVVKSGDNWYCLDGISFSLRWDLPFEEQLSKDWQP